MKTQCLTMMLPAGRPTPQGCHHHAHRQLVKAFARKHHACRLLVVMVVARSTPPPQCHLRHNPKHHLSVATSSQPLWPHHQGDTRLATLRKKLSADHCRHSQATAGHDQRRPDHGQPRPSHSQATAGHSRPRLDHGQPRPSHRWPRPAAGQPRPSHSWPRPAAGQATATTTRTPVSDAESTAGHHESPPAQQMATAAASLHHSATCGRCGPSDAIASFQWPPSPQAH
jgi:hypothetical protein